MKVRIWNGFLMGVVLFGLVFVGGCGTLETLVHKDGDTTPTFGNFIGGDKTGTPPAATTATTSGEVNTIVLYFPDSTGKYLVKELRTVPKTESLARETVTQWLKGPAEQGTTLLASVSTNTLLRDILLKGDVITVDLSEEFMQPNAKVSQEVALYGLVNTLTQFSTVKQVQIRIEGTPLTKYGAINAEMLANKAGLVKGASNSNPIIPSSPNTNKDSGVTDPSKSPSSINVFDYPQSST